ncbi:MAG: sigma-54-dependent transcriptional regulator [Thermoanaerobaculia bacterium]
MSKKPRTSGEGYKILLVDDDPDIHSVLGELLRPAHTLIYAADAAGALDKLDSVDPDVVLLDLKLGAGPDGFIVLEELRVREPSLPVVILSASQDTDTVVRAMKAGASHFIGKPPRFDELRERLRLAVEERQRALQIESYRLPETEVFGSGTAMEEVRELAQIASTTDLPILILGETGTGKSLLASRIHQRSAKRQGPFREVNIAALPPAILDSELFGHERGSFTGADRRRRGLFELAAEGTILLDEIGDLPRECQVKLLHVVEKGWFRRVGSEEDLHTTARVIAATHQDLRSMIAQGAFRSDLYYRLANLVIWIPPLRERWESIAPLARSFLRGQEELTDSAQELLTRQRWPGNIRQLQHTLQVARLFANEGVVGVEQVRRALRQTSLTEEGEAHTNLFEMPYALAAEKAREDFQRDYLQRLLNRCHGNISQAARECGLTRPHLHTLLKKLGLNKPEGYDQK